jgi:hypothetical protein
MTKRQISSVAPKARFRTLITKRDGFVVPSEEPEDDFGGVRVQFFDTGQQKVLHPEIRVQVS